MEVIQFGERVGYVEATKCEYCLRALVRTAEQFLICPRCGPILAHLIEGLTPQESAIAYGIFKEEAWKDRVQ